MDGKTLAPLLAKVLPAVVSVYVIGQRYQLTELKPVGVSSGAEVAPVAEAPKQPFSSGGSGIIFDADMGLIATNHHVIKDAVSINVALNDGRRTPAKLIGFDIGSDIAILKIDLPDLASLTAGNSDDLKIGDYIVAVGNPYGLEGTATAGIVSGLMRSDVGYEIFENFIQIDAAVNPGNSGGALVNLKGELVGINTAIATGGGRATSIGFAIPVNMARQIGKQILVHGRMRRGSLGMATQSIAPDIATALALPSMRGALVTRVTKNSPAAVAGIKSGDIVVAINGVPVKSNGDYGARVSSVPIGDMLELSVRSGDATRNVVLTVSDMRDEPLVVKVPPEARGLAGVSVSSIAPGSPLYGEVRGAVVSELDTTSPAGKAGLQRDDVIVGIGNDDIRDPEQILRLAELNAPMERVRILRQGMPFSLQIGR
jgi:Do/DeqQ family serine protease